MCYWGVDSVHPAIHRASDSDFIPEKVTYTFWSVCLEDRKEEPFSCKRIWPSQILVGIQVSLPIQSKDKKDIAEEHFDHLQEGLRI